jgi:hypothetical protein
LWQKSKQSVVEPIRCLTITTFHNEGDEDMATGTKKGVE